MAGIFPDPSFTRPGGGAGGQTFTLPTVDPFPTNPFQTTDPLNPTLFPTTTTDPFDPFSPIGTTTTTTTTPTIATPITPITPPTQSTQTPSTPPPPVIVTTTTTIPLPNTTPQTSSTPSDTPDPSLASPSVTPVSFIHNHAAITGVSVVAALGFTALLVGLVIFCIRRRRAAQMDREIAEAAAFSRRPFYDEEEKYGRSGTTVGRTASLSDGTSVAPSSSYAPQTPSTYAPPSALYNNPPPSRTRYGGPMPPVPQGSAYNAPPQAQDMPPLPNPHPYTSPLNNPVSIPTQDAYNTGYNSIPPAHVDSSLYPSFPPTASGAPQPSPSGRSGRIGSVSSLGSDGETSPPMPAGYMNTRIAQATQGRSYQPQQPQQQQQAQYGGEPPLHQQYQQLQYQQRQQQQQPGMGMPVAGVRRYSQANGAYPDLSQQVERMVAPAPPKGIGRNPSSASLAIGDGEDYTRRMDLKVVNE